MPTPEQIERPRSSTAAAGAVLAGTLIGPAMGVLLVVGFGPAIGVAALLLLAATVQGALGAVCALRAWRHPAAAERASATAVDPRLAAFAGRAQLVADVRCPAAAPLLPATLTCTLTTPGRPATVQVSWNPSLTGGGSSSLQEDSARHLVAADDLPDPPPPLSATGRGMSGEVVERSVRAAMTRAGFDLGDPRLSPRRCPSVPIGFDGFLRCTVGSSSALRSVDVCPDGDVVRPRLGEPADLRL